MEGRDGTHVFPAEGVEGPGVYELVERECEGDDEVLFGPSLVLSDSGAVRKKRIPSLRSLLREC